jgi:thioester reductase-like protein
MLKELLMTHESDIYVLVRGKNETNSYERLETKLKFYFGDNILNTYSDRLHIINGDISKDFLGMSENKYNELCNKIDCIVHSAAYVKHYGDEELFNKINVVGTENIIKFATKGISKDVNHISTTSVNEGEIDDVEVKLFSEYEMDMGQVTQSLYSKTKLESEKIIMEATKKGIDVKIYRLGNVTFDYDTGQFQENIADNAVCSSLKAFVELKAFPKITERTMNFSYVDQLAKSIVLIMDKVNLKNEVFHIYNPNLVSMYEVGRMLKQKKQSLEVIEFTDFIKYIEKHLEDPNLRVSIDTILLYFDLSGSGTEIVTVNDKTTKILDELGFKWPEFDLDASSRMFDYWIKSEFIN